MMTLPGSHGKTATVGAGFNRPYGTGTNGEIMAQVRRPYGTRTAFLAIPTTGKPQPNGSHQDATAQRHTASFVA